MLDQKNDLISSGYDRVGVKREEFDRIAGELLAEPSVVLCGSSYAFDENATNLQLAAVFKKYLEANPERTQEDVTFLLWLAELQAWRCPAKPSPAQQSPRTLN